MKTFEPKIPQSRENLIKALFNVTQFTRKLLEITPIIINDKNILI